MDPMISVVMPAHNEVGYLGTAVKTVVAGLGAGGREFEVIVVENGSTDSTWIEAEALGAEFDQVRALRLRTADYGAALKAGFLSATGAVVVNFDVDLVDLQFLDRAVTLIDTATAAVVVGSKRAAGAEDERSLGRRLVTATFSFVLKSAFGLKISDTHGAKVLQRESLRPLVEKCEFGQDIFDTELIIRAERAGLAVAEVPIRVTDTRPPRTPIVRRIPRTLRGLVRLHRALATADR
jgi:glycosyltransferase involved in cell wall biosynthesis